MAALLSRLATSLPIEPVAALADLLPGFDLATFSRAPARFDPADLATLTARTLHLLDYGAVRERLPAGMTEAGWLAVRGNLATLADAADWQVVIAGPLVATPAAEDRDFLAAAAAQLAALPWGDDIWGRWTAALKEATGRKGRALFQPLRQALTGRDHGPEMAALLPLIGRDAAVERLRA